MSKPKLKFRLRRALVAFPSSGSYPVKILVDLYNEQYRQWPVQVLGVVKLLRLSMTPERMGRILFCLESKGLVTSETVFGQKLFKLTGKGESAK